MRMKNDKKEKMVSNENYFRSQLI